MSEEYCRCEFRYDDSDCYYCKDQDLIKSLKAENAKLTEALDEVEKKIEVLQIRNFKEYHTDNSWRNNGKLCKEALSTIRKAKEQK